MLKTIIFVLQEFYNVYLRQLTYILGGDFSYLKSIFFWVTTCVFILITFACISLLSKIIKIIFNKKTPIKKDEKTKKVKITSDSKKDEKKPYLDFIDILSSVKPLDSINDEAINNKNNKKESTKLFNNQEIDLLEVKKDISFLNEELMSAKEEIKHTLSELKEAKLEILKLQSESSHDSFEIAPYLKNINMISDKANFKTDLKQALANITNNEKTNALIDLMAKYKDSSTDLVQILIECAKLAKNGDDAIRYYNEVLVIDSNNTVALNSRGNIKSNLKRYHEAIIDYDRVISLKSDSAIIYNNRGVAKKNLGMYKEAIADFDKAIEINPKLTLAYCNRGSCLNKVDSLDKALKDLDKAIKMNEHIAMAYFYRAETFCKMNSFSLALQDFERSYKIMPSLKKRAEQAINKIKESQNGSSDEFSLNQDDINLLLTKGFDFADDEN